MPVQKALRTRAYDKDDLLHGVNTEIVPVLQAVRSIVNRMTSEPAVILADSSNSLEIDWRLGRQYSHALADSLLSVTFLDPADAGEYFLVVTQGGSFTISGWPTTVRWFGGSPPGMTLAGGQIDLIRFFWAGTSYYGSVQRIA